MRNTSQIDKASSVSEPNALFCLERHFVVRNLFPKTPWCRGRKADAIVVGEAHPASNVDTKRFYIALRAYALRLWLRAQMPQLRFGNIF